MSKIGRNAPCPCGSGKKYKKCCLLKEQRRSTAFGKRRSETSDFFEDIPLVPEVERHQGEPAEFAEPPAPEPYDEPFESKTVSDEVPTISGEENAIVDEWWTLYKPMKDLDEILRHLDRFFHAHPGLVPNLALHYEVLFELGSQLVKAGRTSEYIELLVRVRRDFPDTYLKSFSYFDRDIVYHKVASKDFEDIDDFLGWFKEYPDSDADNLFSVIDFLMAAGVEKPLTGLLEAVYYPVCRSDKVYGGGGILQPLILSYYAPYLDNGWTAADLVSLTERLREIRVPLRGELYRPEYLDSLFNEILGELNTDFSVSDHDLQDLYAHYHKVVQNYMGWLRKENRFPWVKAQFYRDSVYKYLVNVIPEGKRPRRPFVFGRNLLEETISKSVRRFLSIDPTQALGSLNAVYWFAEYLSQREAITEKESADVQRWCEEIWRMAIPHVLESTIEGPAFDVFPQ